MLFLFYLERLAGDCVKVALGVVEQNAIPRKAFEAKNNLEAFLDKNVPGIIESVWKQKKAQVQSITTMLTPSIILHT